VACATTGLGMLPRAGSKAPERRLHDPQQSLAAMRPRGAAGKEARPCAGGWEDCWHRISPCDGGASDTRFACPLQLTMRLRAGLRCTAGNKCRRCEAIPGPLFSGEPVLAVRGYDAADDARNCDGVALDVGSISCWRCRRAAVAFFARGLSVPEPVVPDLREESIYAFASQ